MALLKKCNIAKPSVRKETIAVAELGGEVVVRGTMLDERLALVFGASPATGAADDEPGADLEEEDPRRKYRHIARLLAYAVVDANGEPIYTVDEWAEFGGQHFGATLQLYSAARRLSGMDADEAKKNS